MCARVRARVYSLIFLEGIWKRIKSSISLWSNIPHLSPPELSPSLPPKGVAVHLVRKNILELTSRSSMVRVIVLSIPRKMWGSNHVNRTTCPYLSYWLQIALRIKEYYLNKFQFILQKLYIKMWQKDVYNLVIYCL